MSKTIGREVYAQNDDADCTVEVDGGNAYFDIADTSGQTVIFQIDMDIQDDTSPAELYRQPVKQRADIGPGVWMVGPDAGTTSRYCTVGAKAPRGPWSSTDQPVDGLLTITVSGSDTYPDTCREAEIVFRKYVRQVSG